MFVSKQVRLLCNSSCFIASFQNLIDIYIVINSFYILFYKTQVSLQLPLNRCFFFILKKNVLTDF